MDEMNRLIRDKAELSRLTKRLKAEGKKVVTTNGCFDLIHSGHVYILTEARKQGDVLIVGLNSDASVRGNKGPDRPILPENERSAILLALEPVDYVFVFEEIDCMPFIEAANPDVHVKDATASCCEAPTVRAIGARLHLVERQKSLSTTNIVEKMRGAGP